MPGEVLVALAQWAGQTVAAAAVTDVWEETRHKIARLLGRGNPDKTKAAERRLEETHDRLTQATGEDLERVRAAAEAQWTTRLADLLEDDPGVEADLRALVEEIRAKLPVGAVSAANHSVAGNVNVSATSGGVAAAVIHGNVTPLDPTRQGPANT